MTKDLRSANAFVVQFRDVAEGGRHGFTGRVEHVASGSTATFRSIEELSQLLLKMLKGAPQEGSDTE